MSGLVHFHSCTHPLVEDDQGNVVCHQTLPVTWVEFDDSDIDTDIAVANPVDNNVVFVDFPHEND